jgi:hypothetical protein
MGTSLDFKGNRAAQPAARRESIWRLADIQAASSRTLAQFSQRRDSGEISSGHARSPFDLSFGSFREGFRSA